MAVTPRSPLIFDWNRLEGFEFRHKRDLALNDETLRDGLQSPSVRDPDLPQKIRLLHLMEGLGIASVDLGLPGAGVNAMEHIESLMREIVQNKMRILAMRVVLWGKDQSDIPNMISQGAKVRLLGVNIKNGNQGLEIHGNDSTVIEIEGGKEAEPVIARILSIVTTENEKNMILAIDNKKNIYNITDYSNSTSICNEGDVIECMPSKVYGNSVTLDSNSFV